MKLSEQLNNESKAQDRKYPFFINKYLKKEINRIYEEKYVERAFKLGDKIPESTFLNRNNEEQTLTELSSGKPVILSFYRGSWCGFCNLELRYYHHLIEESELDSINMFAITPETPDSSIHSEDLHFSIICDVKNQFAKKLNLVYKPSRLLELIYRMGGINLKKTQVNNEAELPLPATYVIDGEGIITYAFVDPDYKKRAEPSIVLDEYIKLLR